MADTLSGHNKICTDTSGVVWTFNCVKLFACIIDINQQFSSTFACSLLELYLDIISVQIGLGDIRNFYISITLIAISCAAVTVLQVLKL